MWSNGLALVLLVACADPSLLAAPADGAVRSPAAGSSLAAPYAGSMEAPDGVRDVTCQQALDLIRRHAADSAFVILDFRTLEMFDRGHLPGAICYDVFADGIDDWLKTLDSGKTYLIYCTVGHRSGIALDKMKQLGFRKIYHMVEGLKQWNALGYETVSSDESKPQGPPPGSYRMLLGGKSTTVPFELVRNHIVVKARINGKEVRLAVDSGFGGDGAVLFGGPRIEELGLKFAGQAVVQGAGEGSAVPARFSTGNTIGLPGLDLTEQTFIVMPPDSARAVLFAHQDGTIGGSLFNHLVVAVNFDENVLRLSESNGFTYSGRGQKLAMTTLPDGAPCVSASVEMTPGSAAPLDFVLDLGASHALSLHTQTDANIKIPTKAIRYSLGFGVQGEVLGYVGRIAGLHIGPYVLRDVVTSFSESEPLAKIEGGRGNIGMGVIKRFNIIFDRAHGQIVVEPNSRFGEPFEFNMSGLQLSRTANRRYRVARIVPGSPGEDAGFLADDVVVEINGLAADSVGPDDLEQILKKEGGVVAFGVERAGKRIALKVRLRRIV